VVLRDVRVLDRDDPSQALFETREGAVSLDLWNLFRTGELVAGRVRIVGPALTVVRLADGRIRLLGQRERPADRRRSTSIGLPAGRLEIEDATLHYRDLKSGRGPWTLRQVQISLRRAHEAVDVVGSARLPAELGTRVEFDGKLRGSLERFTDLVMQVELRVDQVVLAGIGDLLPDGSRRPSSGTGPLEVAVAFDRGHLEQLRLDFDLSDVVLPVPGRNVPPVEALEVAAPSRPSGASPLTMPAAETKIVYRPVAALPREVRYSSVAGKLRLRRDGDAWNPSQRPEAAAHRRPAHRLDVARRALARTSIQRVRSRRQRQFAGCGRSLAAGAGAGAAIVRPLGRSRSCRDDPQPAGRRRARARRLGASLRGLRRLGRPVVSADRTLARHAG